MNEPTPVETDQVDGVPEQPGIAPSFTDHPPDEGADAEVQKRFKEWQGDYTRKTQALAEEKRELEARRQEADNWRALQEDPDFQRQALEQLGYEVPEPEPQYEPEYIPDPRVDQLMEAERQREMQALAGTIHDHIGKLSNEAGVALTELQREMLFNAAIENPDPSRTEEIFKAVTDDLRAQQAAWEKQWLESKKGVPHVSAGGQEGTKRFDIRDKDERIKRFAAIANSES
jgi:hypothetical protein